LILLLALILLSGLTVACGAKVTETVSFDPESSLISTFEFSSPAFDDGEAIPIEYTCDGENVSPPLRWAEAPSGTRAIAIIVDDPDTPGQIFRHWSVFNLPSGTRSLKAGQPTTPGLENSTLQGQNDFGNTGYDGPCSPAGQEHEYVFFIYALTEHLALDAEATPKQVSETIRGRVIGTGSFSGMYARR
jgi:hypothetical protein